MPSVLGLIASARRLGNTEVMVKEAIKAIVDCGLKAKILRITDLDIKPCTGCMVCVLRRKDCPIEDDMSFLIQEIGKHQGLILGAPTYYLGAAAIIKLIIDRFLMLSFSLEEDWRGYGVVVGLAGLRGWEAFTIPTLSEFVLGFGYQLAGNMIAYSPGPGEVLLTEANTRKAYQLGQRLVTALTENRVKLEPTAENRCPICYSSVLQIMADAEVICPVCDLRGKLTVDNEKISIIFNADGLRNYRWTPANMKRHLREWVIPTGDRFRRHRKQVKVLRKKYEELDYLWVDLEEQRSLRDQKVKPKSELNTERTPKSKNSRKS